MIIQTVSFDDFNYEFSQMSENYKDKFSFEGRRALFDYLENLSEDLGENIELDIIGLCCEYTEYESFKDYQDEYGDKVATIEALSDYTQVIPIEGTTRFIIQNY